MNKRRVVLGFLGTTLDAGSNGRWNRWRPSVALCQHADLPVDRHDLIHGPNSLGLAECIVADIATVSPATEVRRHPMALRDPWDFEEVYAALHDFARGYPSTPMRRIISSILPPARMSRRSAGSC